MFVYIKNNHLYKTFKVSNLIRKSVCLDNNGLGKVTEHLIIK